MCGASWHMVLLGNLTTPSRIFTAMQGLQQASAADWGVVVCGGGGANRGALVKAHR